MWSSCTQELLNGHALLAKQSSTVFFLPRIETKNGKNLILIQHVDMESLECR